MVRRLKRFRAALADIVETARWMWRERKLAKLRGHYLVDEEEDESEASRRITLPDGGK